MIFSENFHNVLCPQSFPVKFMQMSKGWAEWPTRSHLGWKCTTITLCTTWQGCFYFLTELLPWLVSWQCLADIRARRWDYNKQSVHNSACFHTECMWDDKKMVDWQAGTGDCSRVACLIIMWPWFSYNHSRFNSSFALWVSLCCLQI